MELLNQVFRLLENEEKVVMAEAKALEMYFKFERKRGPDGTERKTWSKYVFLIKERPNKEAPTMAWYMVLPVKAMDQRGGKIVKPRYKYISRSGKKHRRAGPREFGYSMQAFKLADEWEMKLIQVVEPKAARLRERIGELRRIRRQFREYIQFAKAMHKELEPFGRYLRPLTKHW